MGYTHYFYQYRDLADDEWRALQSGFLRLIALDGVPPLARIDEDFETPPYVDDHTIYFNGVGEDGHENIVISREAGPSWGGDGAFNFCKTASKPYDVVVTAVLAYLDSSFPDAFTVRSDGAPYDWEKGVSLAHKAWPEVDISVPREVLKDEETYS
jgi:hypothetical protein